MIGNASHDSTADRAAPAWHEVRFALCPQPYVRIGRRPAQSKVGALLAVLAAQLTAVQHPSPALMPPATAEHPLEETHA